MRRAAVLAGIGVVVGTCLLWIIFGGRSACVDAQANEVLAGYTIRVEIDGIVDTEFRGVEGIELDTTVVEFRDGIDPNRIRKIPGSTSWGDLVLKVSPGRLANALWGWYASVLEGGVNKRNMAVILLDPDRQEIVRYLFLEAWPAKWEGARQVASNTAIPVESVTIVCERIQREGR